MRAKVPLERCNSPSSHKRPLSLFEWLFPIQLGYAALPRSTRHRKSLYHPLCKHKVAYSPLPRCSLHLRRFPNLAVEVGADWQSILEVKAACSFPPAFSESSPSLIRAHLRELPPTPHYILRAHRPHLHRPLSAKATVVSISRDVESTAAVLPIAASGRKHARAESDHRSPTRQLHHATTQGASGIRHIPDRGPLSFSRLFEALVAPP